MVKALSSRPRSARPASALGSLLVALILCCSMPAGTAEAKRVALVIGIDAYQSLPKLEKAVNDARAVAAALREIGFDVIAGENLSRRDMNRTFADFEATIDPGDTVFFFFAGHGVALGPENILIAADMPKPGHGREGLVRDEGYALDGIIRRVQGRGALVSFFVLDACRENPFEATGTRNIGGTRGLVRSDPPRGVFVLFSAGLGQTALDLLRPGDPDPNSVFTRKLVPLLRTPGLSHVSLAKRVQQEVDALAATVRHLQQPAYYDQIVGEIVLREGARADPTQQPAVASTPPSWETRLAEERRRWEADATLAEEKRRRERAEAGASAALEALRKMEEERKAQPPAPACPERFSPFARSAGEISCHCPAAAMAGAVWGTRIYTHDSSVCAAARHAGVVTESGGPVRLRAAAGQSSYAGSRRYGITTSNWGPFDGSFVFTSPVVAGESAAEMLCPLNMSGHRGMTQRLTCHCPPGAMMGPVWGSGIYTDDSSLCLAAVHAGVIGPAGGQVTLAPLPGRRSYAGTSRNGVRSLGYGRWDGSFRFVP